MSVPHGTVTASSGPAVGAIRAAESAIGQARALLDAVDNAAANIQQARDGLPAALDELRKDGTTIIASRQLATAGKPTLDLGVVSTEFADAHPEVVDTWRKVQARALTLIKDDPKAAAEAVAAQLNTTPEDAANQLKQGTYLTVAELTSPTWLGTEGNPGNLAENLHSAAEFLAEQQQIPSAPPLKTFQDAIYTKGLPGVVEQQ